MCWLVSASPQVNAPRQALQSVGDRWYRTVWCMSTAQKRLFIAKTSPVMLYSHCSRANEKSPAASTPAASEFVSSTTLRWRNSPAPDAQIAASRLDFQATVPTGMSVVNSLLTSVNVG